jgi:hypothetical protein
MTSHHGQASMLHWKFLAVTDADQFHRGLRGQIALK